MEFVRHNNYNWMNKYIFDSFLTINNVQPYRYLASTIRFRISKTQ